MTAAEQVTFFNLLMGEPASGSDARFGSTQAVEFINEGRRWFAEYTRCFQIKDSQTTNPGGVATKFYSVPNTVIGFYTVEWDGIRLDVIPSANWRDTIGDNDDIGGTPEVMKYFARQIQLFPVPNQQKTLRYEGWGYPNDLQVGGADPDLLDRQARGTIWWAAALAKAADERENANEKAAALAIAEEFQKQYRPATRYVVSRGRGRNVLGRILNG